MAVRESRSELLGPLGGGEHPFGVGKPEPGAAGLRADLDRELAVDVLEQLGGFDEHCARLLGTAVEVLDPPLEPECRRAQDLPARAAPRGR